MRLYYRLSFGRNEFEFIIYKDLKTDENIKTFKIYLAQCEYEIDGDCTYGVSNWDIQRGYCYFPGVADVRHFGDKSEVKTASSLCERAHAFLAALLGLLRDGEHLGELRH